MMILLVKALLVRPRRSSFIPTLGCHLCDQVSDLLAQAGMAVQPVEIADDDTLFERYDELIPVVVRVGTTGADVELRWPFDLAQLAALASEL